MKTFALLLTLLMLPANAQAGTTGNISGFVRDERDMPIADAVVKIVSASESRTARTDSHGYYVLMALSPDTYTVSVEKSRYHPESIAGVLIASDSSNRIATTLMPAGNYDWVVGPPLRSVLVSGDRSWDSYIIPRFLIESQIP